MTTMQESVTGVIRTISRTGCVFVVCALFSAVLLAPVSVHATPISRTITIDGTMTDWTVPTDITTNPGQFSTDGDGSVCPSTDLDADPDGPGGSPCVTITPSGRDLARFAYTWDANNVYFYVQRVVGTANTTDWFFYLDLGNDGFMGAGDKVLRIAWRGSNRNTTRELWDYVPVGGGLGDALCGDGCTMPGSITNNVGLGTSTGGSASQLSMESWASWATLGMAGPQSLRFHIGSGNNTNLPGGILDNMDGPPGGGLAFSEIAVTKTTPLATVYAASVFSYTVTVTNSGDSDATNVEITDLLPAGVTYQSHVASQGAYVPGTGIWTVGTIPYTTPVNTSETLTITVSADQVAVDTLVTNTASLTAVDQADTISANNTASAPVTVKPAPLITIQKTVSIRLDGFSATNPKAIPGATLRYKISVDNSGLGTADSGSVVITDPIPVNADFYANNLGVGPIIFTDRATGMTLTTGDLDYFDTAWGATLNPDVDGFDPAIRSIRISPQGVFPAYSGAGATPGFDIEFDVRVQ